MALNATTLLLVLAITFMQSIFGFFSGMINVFCSIVSVVVALGFYEALNDFITRSFELHPGYTEPICLIALFILTMAVTRTLADNYIRGNVKVPMAVDWGGAAVCGFINAQLIVGMIVLAVLMLPLGGTVLQFSRYERNPDDQDFDHPDLVKFDRNHLWSRSDEFTVGLFNLISGGSMKGRTAFASVYPDFTDVVFFTTNTVQAESTPSPYRKEKGREDDGFKKGLVVEQWWEETGPIEARYRKEVPTARQQTPDYDRTTFKVAPGKKLIATHLVLHKSSADREKSDVLHLFRPTMLRLVGTRGGNYEQYVPCILANADSKIAGQPRIVDYDNNFSLPARGNVRIYAYFEVDRDFRPTFVEYRRHARASLPARSEETPELQLTLAGDAGERRRGRDASGGRTFGRVLEENSGDNPRLPFAMARRVLQGAGSDVTLDRDEFAAGRVFGARSRLEQTGDGAKVEEFKVPAGWRLLQVRYKPKEARTVAGQVFNYVGQLNQYYAEDTAANRYPLAGYYAIVTRGREEYIELFYAGDPDSPEAISFNQMLDFKQLQRSEINDQDESVISLLFLVPPGTEIRRIVNQSGDGGEVRLRARRSGG